MRPLPLRHALRPVRVIVARAEVSAAGAAAEIVMRVVIVSVMHARLPSQ
jgi:hypothetical protein